MSLPLFNLSALMASLHVPVDTEFVLVSNVVDVQVAPSNIETFWLCTSKIKVRNVMIVLSLGVYTICL